MGVGEQGGSQGWTRPSLWPHLCGSVKMPMSAFMPHAWAEHHSSRVPGPSAPARSLCPRWPVSTPLPFILPAEDGPGKRQWLLGTYSGSSQGGKRHCPCTPRVHLPIFLSCRTVYLFSFSVGVFFLTLFIAEDHWPRVSVRGIWVGHTPVSSLAGEQSGQEGLLPKVSQTSSSTCLQSGFLRTA